MNATATSNAPPSEPRAAMPGASALASTPPTMAPGIPAVLRGTGRGLELHVAYTASIDEVEAVLLERFEQAPTFFTGNDLTVRLNGAKLPPGSLARLEGVCARFGVRIAEVLRAASESARPILSTPEPAAPSVKPALASPAPSSATATAPVSITPADIAGSGSARFHLGQVRSGTVVEASGDLVVVGDVNPGAELRAGGSIVVMGSLRGVAHAGFGQETFAGFILALKLDAPLVRVGKLIARADGKGTRGVEIAHGDGNGHIVVEPYAGRLPFGVR